MFSKISILFSTLFISMSALAHQPDVSTTMLVQQADKSWILVVKAALTAFEYEVNTTFGEESFATPEEFQKLAAEHLEQNINIDIDGKNSDISLTDPQIKLGHETNAVFKLENMPPNFQSISVTNSSFKDISRNQSALLILKEGTEKQQFILDNANHHTVTLDVKDNQFIQTSKQVASGKKGHIAKMVLFVFLMLGLGLLINRFFVRRSRNNVS